jgi:hypothetical protein
MNRVQAAGLISPERNGICDLSLGFIVFYQYVRQNNEYGVRRHSGIAGGICE